MFVVGSYGNRFGFGWRRGQRDRPFYLVSLVLRNGTVGFAVSTWWYIFMAATYEKLWSCGPRETLCVTGNSKYGELFCKEDVVILKTITSNAYTGLVVGPCPEFLIQNPDVVEQEEMHWDFQEGRKVAAAGGCWAELFQQINLEHLENLYRHCVLSRMLQFYGPSSLVKVCNLLKKTCKSILVDSAQGNLSPDFVVDWNKFLNANNEFVKNKRIQSRCCCTERRLWSCASTVIWYLLKI